jgi:hypothetical protein
MKTAAETCAIGANHKYLGHFAKAVHLNRGHNVDEVVPAKGPQSDKEATAAKEEAQRQADRQKAASMPFSPTGRVINGVLYTPGRISEIQRTGK